MMMTMWKSCGCNIELSIVEEVVAELAKKPCKYLNRSVNKSELR